MESTETESNIQSNSASTVSRIQINDNKAGMQNLDKDKINAIILKHSQSKASSKVISFLIYSRFNSN